MVVIEGLRLVQEALDAHLSVTDIFYVGTLAESAAGKALLETCAARSYPLWEVSPAVMQALSDTETPQGICAVVPVPTVPVTDSVPLILIPDSVRDPGNLGTILRVAWAAGVSQVLLPPGTVDYLNPKVLRSGMGAHFHLATRRVSWEGIRAAVAGTDVWLAEAGPGVPYDVVDWRWRVALIVGGEAAGASPEGRALAGDRCVYIPMAPGVDSLNVAMATSVLLFEAARQRGVGRGQNGK